MLAKMQSYVADWLRGEIQKALELQGHVATGKLKESIDVQVTQAVDLFSIDGRFIRYGKFVDTGTKGGGWVPIEMMIAWVRIKKVSFAGKSELQTAKLIQWKIFKKGSPTNGDEKKKRFLSLTLEQQESEIIKRITEVVGDFITIEFFNMIEKVQKEFDAQKLAA